ncbi:MAG: hypothetical protein ACYCYM_02990 [Saccharofermentanales bacterium]
MGSVNIEKISHLGWANCVKISNGEVDLIVTTDVGPRIIYFGFTGGFNHMKVYDRQAGETGSDKWMIYGGHRLWHSPESRPRTYDLDNFPCEWKIIKNGIVISSPMDKNVQIAKKMEIRLSPKGTKVTIDHHLTNMNAWNVEYAAWALTVMAQDGRLIIPQPGEGPELLSNRNITLWTYTMMNDPRVQWLDRYIFLDQDRKARYGSDVPAHRRFTGKPFKIGLSVPDGWVAYANNGQLFVKYFDHVEGERYPDSGFCSFETYTNTDMIEIETLSPLTCVDPGQTLMHQEIWQLFDNITEPATESDVDISILPLL